MPKKGQKFKQYDREFVMTVIQEKLQEGLSYTQLSRKYGIPEGTISGWVYKYNSKAWDCTIEEAKRMKKISIIK